MPSSADLLHWQAQPPLSEPGGGFGQMEVFQLAVVDGRPVLVFNCLPKRTFRAAAGHRYQRRHLGGATPSPRSGPTTSQARRR